VELTVAGENGRWRVVGQAATADLELVNDYRREAAGQRSGARRGRGFSGIVA